MPQLIPESWKEDVIRILRTSDSHRIEWTLRARQDWSFYGFQYLAYDALIAALSNPAITGNPVEMTGADETYEFFFAFRDKTLYGKVGLKDNRVRIKIFSTHRPNRPAL
jgi:hypothetical protein